MLTAVYWDYIHVGVEGEKMLFCSVSFCFKANKRVLISLLL